MIDARCPLCGDPGPHPVAADDDPERHVVTIDCRSCGRLSTVEVD